MKSESVMESLRKTVQNRGCQQVHKAGTYISENSIKKGKFWQMKKHFKIEFIKNEELKWGKGRKWETWQVRRKFRYGSANQIGPEHTTGNDVSEHNISSRRENTSAN